MKYLFDFLISATKNKTDKFGKNKRKYMKRRKVKTVKKKGNFSRKKFLLF